MVAEACTQEQFVALFRELGSPQAVSKALNMNIRSVYRRRNYLATQGIVLETRNVKGHSVDFDKEAIKKKLEERLSATRHSARRGIAMEKGRILVFSDAHFYPDDETTAFRALIECIKEFKPEVIVCNGDAFDGASISRHPRIGWDSKPSVKEELGACIDHMNQIESASTFKSNLIWTLGNHDARFETFLAANAPQYEGVQGYSLKDFFPNWQPCYSYWVNDDTVIKHSWKGGFSAGRANTLNAGVNMITGHTHNMAVQPLTDYRGTRYGVQTGMLANPDGDQFLDYTQDGVKDWRSGFAMLTFDRGQLLMPELIQVWDETKGEVQFRGKIYSV
jgi:Calcineurin-like phosphoesterase